MATDFFLKLDGITGESQDKTHKNEIQMLAWSWGMAQSGTFSNGTGGTQGKVNVQDISFSKFIDTATTSLIKHLVTGQHIKSGKLTARKSGPSPVEYVVIDFTDIIVTSYSTGGSADQADRVTETISLNFAQFKIDYTPQSNTGVAGAKTTAGWNAQTNETVG